MKQWDEKIKGLIPQHIFERLNNETLHEIAEITQSLCTAKASMPEPVDLKAKQSSFKAALDSLRDPEAPAIAKNALLKECIERIDYYREQIDGGHRVIKHNATPIELHFRLRV